jgi:hypothetical protein
MGGFRTDLECIVSAQSRHMMIPLRLARERGSILCTLLSRRRNYFAKRWAQVRYCG